MPLSASFDLPATAAIREEPLAKSHSAADDGLDILPKPLARENEEFNVAVEG